MSDIVMNDIVKQLRGSGDCQTACQCLLCEAADEIESLRAKIAEKNQIIQQQDRANSALVERIGELERQVVLSGWNDFEGDVSGMHIITTEQINEAWRIARESSQKDYANDGVFVAIEYFNIVPCDQCGGGVSKAWDNGCPDCHGHGWRIKE